MNDPDLYGSTLIAKDIDVMAHLWSFGIKVGTSEGPSAAINDYISLRDFKYEDDYPVAIARAIYSKMYNVIVQANVILKNLEKYPDAIKNPQLKSIIKAEALAIRGFCHMDILRLFGQMPNHAGPAQSLPYQQQVSKEDVPKYDFAQFVQKILDDFDEAEKLMAEYDPLVMKKDNDEFYKYDEAYKDEDFLSYRRFRFNYYGVLALKARLYMYINDAEKARKYADQVITSCNLQMSRASFTKDVNSKYYSLPSECIMALNAFEIYQNLDGRIMASNGFYMETEALSTLFGNANNSNRKGLWDENSVDEQSRKRPALLKYRQPKEGSVKVAIATFYHHVVPIIRVSEMYLIMLETSPSITEFNEYYDTYRSARDLTSAPIDNMEIAMTEVMNEYRRELIGEGQVFYTYKRRGEKTMLFRGTRNVTAENYIVPVPKTELN